MGVHIVGHGHDVVIYKSLRCWADRGLFHMEDSRDNSYKARSVHDALIHIRAISDMIGNSTDKESRTEFGNEIEEKQRWVLQMIELCKKAKAQGMPTDASASNRLKAARPQSISVPFMPEWDY